VKILVDTCAWSLLLRRKNGTVLSKEERRMLDSLTDAVNDGRVGIIGPIRQEILAGIREMAQFKKLQRALEPFQDEDLTTADFERAAGFFNLCRRRGIECGATDVLICAVASRMRWLVLTSDRGLRQCIEVLRDDGAMS
jgi:predicted nucleic acid-binding protein